MQSDERSEEAIHEGFLCHGHLCQSVLRQVLENVTLPLHCLVLVVLPCQPWLSPEVKEQHLSVWPRVRQHLLHKHWAGMLEASPPKFHALQRPAFARDTDCLAPIGDVSLLHPGRCDLLLPKLLGESVLSGTKRTHPQPLTAPEN